MVASWLLSSEMGLKSVFAIAPRFSRTLVCSLMRRARALVSGLKVVMVMQSATPDGRQAQALEIEAIFCNSDISKPNFSGIQG